MPVGRAEPQPDLQVLLVRDAGVLHQQLAGHAQVRHERDGGGRLRTALRTVPDGGRRVRQRHPQEFAAADHVQDPGAFKVAGEVLRAQGVPAEGARIQDLDGGDGPAAHPAHQAAADHLDLGQFRQRRCLAAGLGLQLLPDRGCRRPGPVSRRQASAAASCSASFLELPEPVP